ncbi:MAG: MCP four helix bundle domain-containing protein [Gammaproteobacteria bacterium]|nr:MCP four helix bundle domain-containing protein [Gammaproteobacteria bacterium]
MDFKLDSSKKIISFGFLLMWFLLTLITIIGLQNMSSINDDLNNIVHKTNVKTEIVNGIKSLSGERFVILYHMGLDPDPFTIDELKAKMFFKASVFLELQDKLFNTQLSSEEKLKIEQTFQQAYKTNKVQQQYIAMLEEEPESSTQFLMEKIIPQQNKLLQMYNDIVEYEYSLADKAAEQAENSYRFSIIMMLSLGVVISLLGLMISVYMIKKIGKAESLLVQHQENLQTQVEERTLELSKAKTEAESSNKAKSIFLANMSHEIRTPLNAIIGFTYILENNDITDQHEHKNKLHKISEAAKHLLAIINDILDFSKIEAGKLELENTDFSLSKIMKRTSSLISEHAKQKDIDIVVDLDSSIPDMLEGDPLRLGQLLLNFANNAVKFTEQGQITIKASLQSENGADNKIKILFEVIDTGVGISSAKQEKLFNAFEQADDSTTRKYGGTGLGLAICSKIAQLMGGTIGVYSELGKGSNFWFNGCFKTMAPIDTLFEEKPIIGQENNIEKLNSKYSPPDYLLSITGLNIENALISFKGDINKYQLELKCFISEQESIVEKIKVCLREKELTEASRHAHNLKSVAATLGMIEIKKLAGEVEYKLKAQNEKVNDELEQLKVHINNMINALIESLPQAKDSSIDLTEQQLSSEQFYQGLNELLDLLQQDDFQSNQAFQSLYPFLMQLNEGQAYKLAECINAYDFEEAINIVREFQGVDGTND